MRYEYIKHTGVLGMKWGVRKQTPMKDKVTSFRKKNIRNQLMKDTVNDYILEAGGKKKALSKNRKEFATNLLLGLGTYTIASLTPGNSRVTRLLKAFAAGEVVGSIVVGSLGEHTINKHGTN